LNSSLEPENWSEQVLTDNSSTGAHRESLPTESKNEFTTPGWLICSLPEPSSDSINTPVNLNMHVSKQQLEKLESCTSSTTSHNHKQITFIVFFGNVWEKISALMIARRVVEFPNYKQWILAAECEICSDVVEVPTFSILSFLGLNRQINLSGKMFEVSKLAGGCFTLNRSKEAHKTSAIKILFKSSFPIFTARLSR
jgi:hypothetical protein